MINANNITATQNNQTMSSVDLAKILGCRVNDANNRIERNSKKYNIELPEPVESELANGEIQRQYNLDLKTFLALITFMRADIGLKVFDQVIQNTTQAINVISALNNFEVPDNLPDMYVYYIQNEDSGAVKIGISKNPETRLKQLQIGCDGKLKLLGYRLAENRFSDEAIEHKKHKDNHIHGEWFNAYVAFNMEGI